MCQFLTMLARIPLNPANEFSGSLKRVLPTEAKPSTPFANAHASRSNPTVLRVPIGARTRALMRQCSPTCQSRGT